MAAATKSGGKDGDAVDGETRRLVEADQHIAEAERQIAEQRNRLRALESGGHDTQHAVELLRNLNEVLIAARERRELIRAEIARGHRSLR